MTVSIAQRPNPDHLAKLLLGIPAWDRWRNQIDINPNLSGLSTSDLLRSDGLSNAEKRINLGFGNFQSVDLSYSNLAGVHLVRTDLQNASLRESNLEGAVLIAAKLRGADLYHAKTNGSFFGLADIANTDLTLTQLWNAKLHPGSDSETDLEPIANDQRPIATIGDLSNLIGHLEERFADRSGRHRVTLYFRGQESDEWILQPSVMRPDPKYMGLGLRMVEHEILTELMARQPDPFHNTSSAFAQLVLARHHRLPSRLLDVTRNPLVGLFNACVNTEDPHQPAKQAQSRDGRLHVFAVPNEMIRRFNSDAVSVIANFTKLSRGEKNTVLTKTEEDIDEYDDIKPGFYVHNQPFDYGYREMLARLRQFVGQEKPNFEDRIDPRDFFRVLVVEPQQSFPRIRAQSGAFLISAFHERFERTEILKRSAGLPVYGHFVQTVPKDRKQEILHELRRLNITRETLFPGLDEAGEGDNREL